MQDHTCENPLPVVPGRVNEIRKVWCVQEDEALAIRLQKEEINQHYNGNRTRNAQVRQDIPTAKAEQRRAEEDALEERMRQIQLRQKQAEEDALIAKQLAERYEQGLETDNFSDVNRSVNQAPAVSGSHAGSSPQSGVVKPPALSPLSVKVPSPSDGDHPSRRFNNVNIMHSPTGSYRSSSSSSNGGREISQNSGSTSNLSASACSSAASTNESKMKKTKSIMKTTSAYGRPTSSSPVLGACALLPNEAGDEEDAANLMEEERERIRQEKLDEELALKLQQELEQQEVDKRLAIEAQDRELAKLLHQRDREKLKRAKERAKAKAVAKGNASSNSEHEDHIEVLPDGVNGGLAAKYSVNNGSNHSSNHSNIFVNQFPEAAPMPPKLPEKNRLRADEVLGFRAAPKALPPQPSVLLVPEIRSNYFRNPQASSSHPIAGPALPRDEPVPPYMPLQGLQPGVTKKRSK